MKSVNNQRGFVLVMVLGLMVIMTLLGIMVIDFSTIDLQITGNQKQAAIAVEGADAGLDLSIPVIEGTLQGGVLDAAAITDLGVVTAVDTTDLEDEINGAKSLDADTAAASPDLTMDDLGGVTVQVDIDRMISDVLPGGAMDFASGYEGIGSGASGGGVQVLYRVQSQGARN